MTRTFWAVVALCIALAGCQPSQPEPRNASKPLPRSGESVELPKAKGDGLALLKEVMDAYHGARTFQSTSSVEMLGNGDAKDKAVTERLILIHNPNRFRVTCSIGNIKAVSVSDGVNVLEYTNANAEKYDAPRSIAEANSQQLSTFSLGGSLLYRFFAGSEFLDEVVRVDHSPVELLESKVPNEAIIRFYAVDPWGETQLFVDTRTKQVKKIVSQMNAVVRDSQAIEDREYRLDSLVVTESFSNSHFNKAIDSEAFVLTPPAGVQVKSLTSESGGTPKLGSPAPDFEVTGEGGDKVSLLGLRDSIVMIDFWATWCGPCKKGLPDTVSIHKQYKDKGLKVLAITEEPAELVKQFKIEAGLPDLPVFYDPEGKAGTKYGVTSIPCVVIIDRRGGISDILVGLHEKHDILKALRRAGLQL